MTIPLIDRIVPKNNGSFPVYNSQDGYGSWQTRLNTTDRDSIFQLNRYQGMIVHTISDGYFWELGASLQNTDWHLASFSGSNAIAVDLNITGQQKGSTLYFNGSNWVQLPPGTDGYLLTTHGTSANPTWTPPSTTQQTALGYIANWYVDATNGNDNNNGLTSGTALKTTERLSQILCPNFQKITFHQKTIVNLAAGSYGELALNFDWPSDLIISDDILLEINGAVTESAPITFSAVTQTTPGNPTGGIRGQVTTLSGTFIPQSRMISPPGDYNLGNVAWSTGLNANAQNTFVSNWIDIFGHPSVVNVVAGSQASISTINTTVKYLKINSFGIADNTIQLFSIIQNCIINGGEVTGPYNTSLNDYMFQINYCDMNGDWLNCNADVSFCKFLPTTTFYDGNPRFFGCNFNSAVTFRFSSYMQLRSGNFFDGGKLIFSDNAQGLSVNFVEYCNGVSGSAVTVNTGCLYTIRQFQWGASTNYTTGYTVSAGGNIVLGFLSFPAIPSTNNININTHNLSYSALPLTYPISNCSIVVDQDSTSTANLYIPGQTQGDIIYFNGTNWVKLASGTDGYFLQTHASGPVWAAGNSNSTSNWFIANWFINASTGSDTNNGLTSGTALKTIEELCNRLCPNGEVAFLKQTTTVTIAAGTYGSPYFNIGSGSLVVNCAITSTANITTNSVTNTNAASTIRGEIETASGTFTDQRRIRATSGTNTGAIAWSTGLNGGVTKTFVSSFISATGTQVNITNGDNVVVDTLAVTFNSASLLTTVNSSIKITGGTFSNSCYSSQNVTFNECHFSIGTILLGGGNIQFCSFNNISIGNGNYNGFGNQFLGINNSYYAQFNLISSNVFDDSNSLIGVDVNFNFIDLELVRRTLTTGLIFPIGSKVNSIGYLWSGTGAYGVTAVQMDPGSYFSFTNLPTVSGASNIKIAGVGFIWPQLPQSVGSATAEFNTLFTSAANDIQYWTGNYWKRLAAGSDGYILTTHSTTSAPTWNKPSIVDGYALTISGQTQGDILYYNGTNWTKLSASTDGYTLTTHGSGNNPTWASAVGLPLRATYYVDPLFSGVSNGSQSAPYKSVTAVIAIAPSTGALIIMAPQSNSTENITFPTTGDWELQCMDNARATVTGNVTCTSVAQCSYRFTNIVITGTLSGDATSSSGNFCILTNAQILGNVTLTRSGSGAWFTVLRGLGSNFFGFSGSIGGTFNIAGQLLAQHYLFTGAVSFTSAGSEFFNCRFTAAGVSLGGGSALIYNTVFTASPTFTGPGTISMDGFSYIPTLTLAAGATLTLRNALTTGTPTLGDIIFYDGTIWNRLAASQDGYVLTTHGTSANPTWGSITGTLPSGTKGDILYSNGSSFVNLPAGPDGYVLTTHTSANIPTWSAPQLTTQVANGFVANWYVDSVGGSDNNNGKSAITAFKTTEKLSQTLCPGGQKIILQQNTTINLAAGSYTEISLNIDWPAGTSIYGLNLIIIGASSSTSPITLSAVTNTNSTTSTRGQVTTASGSFTAQKRIRSTSGANIGAIAYSTGANGGATNHFVGPWYNFNTDAIVNIVNGTTCVVDTLLASVNVININTAGNGYVTVQDLILDTTTNTTSSSISQTVEYFGCEINCINGTWYNTSSAAGIYSCRITGNTFFEGAQWFVYGCSIQKTLFLFARDTGLRFDFANVIDGGNITLQRGAYLFINSAVEHENGTATSAYNLDPGCTIFNNGAAMWGASTAYTTGFTLVSSSQMVINGLASLISFPSTTNYLLAGHATTYAQVPIAYPQANCSISLTPDSANILALSSTALTIGSNVTSPQILQQSLSTVSTVGQSLNITAQSVTGLNSRGGNLILGSGVGTSTQGAPDGYVTINRGSQIVAQWQTGVINNTFDDFIALGRATATQGNIRLANTARIFGRDATNTSDQSLFNWANGSLDLSNANIGSRLFGTSLNLISGINGIQIITSSNQPALAIIPSGFANVLSLGGAGGTFTQHFIQSLDNGLTPSRTGAPLTISSTTMSNANTLGGSLILQSGTGIANAGGINASDGYVLINRGTNTVISFTDGYSDFIQLGATPGLLGAVGRPGASTGHIRMPNTSSIRFRNALNTADIVALQVTALNSVVTGGTNFAIGSDAVNYQSMAGGVFIAESTVAPTANPSGGSFLYVNSVNHHPTIRTSDGYIVDLTAAASFNISGQTLGDILYYNGVSWARLPASIDGYSLITHSTISSPTWKPNTPFTSTFYVDPTFTGFKNGSQSNPYSSITAAIAAAPSTGALIILAPNSFTIENITIPSTGNWEIITDGMEALATITGNITFSTAVASFFTFRNITISGNISGSCSGTSSPFLVLYNAFIVGTVTLTASSSGQWTLDVGGLGGNFQGSSGSISGAVSIAGGIIGNNFSFTNNITLTGRTRLSHIGFGTSTTITVSGAPDVTLISCNIGSGVSWVGSGSTVLYIDGHTMGTMMLQVAATTFTGCVISTRNANGSVDGTSAPINTTIFLAAAPAGMYKVNATAFLTTSGGTGTLLVDTNYTDAGGTARTIAVTTTGLVLNGTAGTEDAGSTRAFYHNGSSSITYTVKGVGSAGSSVHLAVSCRRET